MSIWSSVFPERMEADPLDPIAHRDNYTAEPGELGEAYIDVATATAWHSCIRLAATDPDGGYVRFILTAEQAQELIRRLQVAIDRTRTP